MRATPPIDVTGTEAASDLRVLLTVRSLASQTGGPAMTVSYLARDLAARGVSAGVLAGKSEKGTRIADSRVPVKYARYGGAGVASKSVVRCFFHGQPPNLIHDNGLWLRFNHRVAVLSRQLGIPRIVSPRGMLEPWAMQRKPWKKMLAWHVYQRRDLDAAALIHATSPEEAENLRRLGLTRPIIVIPNGVELPGSELLERKDRQYRAVRYALFLSRIHPKKGLLNLIEAWGSERPSNWVLIIAGPDQNGHQKVVERAVSRLGLEDAIRFTGPVYGREKDDLFCQADLFILPTFSENFGLVVAEALAWGVPVITTKGAPWKVLELERCGWWVDIGVDPLVSALRHATTLPHEALQTMGTRGRALVERDFSWQRVAAQMATVYRQVLEPQQQPET